MNKIYGLPYMGSKGRFVEDFFDIIPQKKRFYDLFHGGLAVTHYALLHTDVEVISNERIFVPNHQVEKFDRERTDVLF